MVVTVKPSHFAYIKKPVRGSVGRSEERVQEEGLSEGPVGELPESLHVLRAIAAEVDVVGVLIGRRPGEREYRQQKNQVMKSDQAHQPIPSVKFLSANIVCSRKGFE